MNLEEVKKWLPNFEGTFVKTNNPSLGPVSPPLIAKHIAAKFVKICQEAAVKKKTRLFFLNAIDSIASQKFYEFSLSSVIHFPNAELVRLVLIVYFLMSVRAM